MAQTFRRMARRIASSVGHTLAWLALGGGLLHAQASQDWLQPVEGFAPATSTMHLQERTQAPQPFTVAGECNAILGLQNGEFESWIFPVKILSHMSIEARIQDWDVPVDVNPYTALIDVQPDHTTITYSHVAFTLKETIFAPPCGQQDPNKTATGAVVLFTLDSVRPMTLTISFRPELKPMWPAPQLGETDAEWLPLNPRAPNGMTQPGWYMLHTDWPELAAGVAMPGTLPGIMEPYQERPKYYPTQFVLHYDPKTDHGKSYPLLMAVGTTKAAATSFALEAALRRENAEISDLYRQTADYYAHYFDDRMTVETPDKAFDEYFRWAEVSIDQLRVRHGNEVGLVAGFYSSGNSARPGFGWFFGRDTLYTTYAVNSYGDFPLTKEALAFLIARQRADGKMPHEYSQTANEVNWASTEYEYAAADSTPLFLMAMEDYVRESGDVAFLKQEWPAVAKAWTFEITHDSDGDGIYDNSQGTGWVESWIPAMPHQEIYLALLDEQASGAMAHLGKLMQQPDIASQASERATRIAAKIPQEYMPQDGMYAFSYNGKLGVDHTATIYPSIAWWDGQASLPDAGTMFSRWASDEFSTDWGTRDVGDHEAIYDPISYHQGSVWPLFTGWTTVAEYRTGHTLSGYAHLMQTANLTTAQDLGAVTELLSGDFFTPFGRSTSHQLWSSAMVIAPAIRGLFGVSVDATTQTVTVDPRLPAQWDHATLHNLHVGSALVDLHYQRTAAGWEIRAEGDGARGIKLKSAAPGARMKDASLMVPTPAVEVGMDFGANDALPTAGARTAMMKVLEQTPGARSLTLMLEAQGGSTQRLYVRRSERTRVTVQGGAIAADGKLDVRFPAGGGYVRQQVVLHW